MKRLQAIQEGIHQHILHVQEQQFFGLLGGGMGNVLLALMANINDFPYSEYIESSYLSKQQLPYKTFSAGTAGINWVYTILYKRGILDKDDYDFLCSDDTDLQEFALSEIKQENYDFLHGALGVAWYLLAKYEEQQHAPFFAAFFAELHNILLTGEEYTIKSKDGKINIGLSHGITSILKFCLQAYKQSVCRQEALLIADAIIRFLMNNRNTDMSYSHFPYVVHTDKKDESSRLAWCYGDLGIGIILLQAAALLDRSDVHEFAVTLLLHSAGRRSPEATGVKDGGLCHGTAGIAYMFQKAHSYVRMPAFSEAAGYWMQQTVDYAITGEDGTITYTMFKGEGNEYTPNRSLLEGSVGVGLAMQSYQSGEFDWDYCIMLND
ncbi:hypothetical protein F0L74_24720 [Chitinophaga agrisoli]|uniref:Lanthionine synthetase-like protein n=1 Tax=Chitinophaga agrisoli TaxID=2607653 RepID=A0A5B2VMM7_9BACT|nr:lanthionine synthetase LanC family protein [Chitinophaga agrisoli]KAA2239409.1 hypothetical protein F0L74_24720 [Chitinophaga agrisoli]